MTTSIDRRSLLLSGATAAGLWGVASSHAAAAPENSDPRQAFRYCLNTSTIRGQKLSVLDQVDVAIRAGYDAIEPWMGDLRAFVEGGGNLDELRQRIADGGLEVPSAIGFAAWIVDDPEERKKGLETARSDMQLLRAIGGTRIAAPPVGVTQQSGLDLFAAAERYRELLAVGQQEGVVPQLELWGFSKSLNRLGELALVATEASHPEACLLPDVYHIYKGGSDFAGLRMLNGATIHVFHMNDYPADPPREAITDADRVYPGDGVAPLGDILRTLYATGFRGALSLELFNRTYWQQDALAVARRGLEAMRAAVEQAFA